MNIADIESALSVLAEEKFNGETFPYKFIEAFDAPKSSVTKLRQGHTNKATQDGDILWQKNLFYRKVAKGKADGALRVGRLVSDKGLITPGRDLVIKMALRRKNGWFTNTFSVRYRWEDVLAATRKRSPAADLASKGKVERIWLEYWPTMCSNKAPTSLFEDGDGDALMPEDVDASKPADCKRTH